MDNRLLGPTKCPQILAQQRQRDKHYLDSIATSISRLQLNILDSLDHLNRSDDRWRRGLVSKRWTIHQKINVRRERRSQRPELKDHLQGELSDPRVGRSSNGPKR